MGKIRIVNRIVKSVRIRFTIMGDAVSRTVNIMRLGTRRAILRPTFPPQYKNENTLYAFYDLDIEPVTFDFLWFLVAADLRRRELGLDSLHVIFVPGSAEGFRIERSDYEAIVDHRARQWRVTNMIIPAIQFLPSCSGHTICHTREQAAVLQLLIRHMYPNGYLPSFGVAGGYHVASYIEAVAAARTGQEISVLRSTEQGQRYVEQWLEHRARGRRVVTIALRDYKYMPARNSNLDAWISFAKSLDPKQYFVVFVPDADTALEYDSDKFEGQTVFGEAAFNLGLRMALGKCSYLTLGVSSGPMALWVLNALVPCLMFKIIVPGVPQTTEEFVRGRGLSPGEKQPFLKRHQKYVWEDDDLDVIQREFQAMCDVLEDRDGSGCELQSEAPTTPAGL